MTKDDLRQNQMTQSDLEWPRTAVDKVWMTQYDFRWVKSRVSVQETNVSQVYSCLY